MTDAVQDVQSDCAAPSELNVRPLVGVQSPHDATDGKRCLGALKDPMNPIVPQ